MTTLHFEQDWQNINCLVPIYDNSVVLAPKFG